MPEDFSKKLTVTFGTGMPLGEHAKFKHEGQLWVAYPAKRDTEILTVIDRLIGMQNRINNELIRWINKWPEDAIRAAALFELVARRQKELNKLTIDKQKVGE